MINQQQIALSIAERLRSIVTKQGNVPFRTGNLRKSHLVKIDALGARMVAATPYARAVHDGTPAMTIKPKNKKTLAFRKGGKMIFAKQVKMPARKGNPWIKKALAQMQIEGLGFLANQITDQTRRDLKKRLRGLKIS